jgi:hypothetical protein
VPVAVTANAPSRYCRKKKMNDSDEQYPPRGLLFLLTPEFESERELRAAAEPQPESNVIYLADYKRLH